MSRLQIIIPSTLKRTGGYAHEEALFGIPKYGGSIAEVRAPRSAPENTAAVCGRLAYEYARLSLLGTPIVESAVLPEPFALG